MNMSQANPSNAGNPKIEEIRTDVWRSYEVLNELINGALAQLAPVQLYASPGADEWTIMENLAHIVEFMPYWAGEFAALVARPGKSFGRTQQDEGRLGAIRDHRRDTLDQIREALPGSYARLDEVLGSLTDEDLEITGMHVRLGEKPLGWFIEEFVTGHLRAHLGQMREVVEALT
jgi:uncharacterized damage-inducible protein DinB